MSMTIYLLGEFEAKELRTIWRYKYLGENYESFNKKQKELITRYEETIRPPSNEIELPLYIKGIKRTLKNLRTLEESLEFVTEEK